MVDLILFGIQGSGKGTQAKSLAKKFDMIIFEMGQELRSHIKKQTKLGKKIKNIVESGNLVSDDIVLEIVSGFLKKTDKNKAIIFDGMPRTHAQIGILNRILAARNRKYKAVLIELDKKEAFNRLAKRRICDSCYEIFPSQYKKNICKKCGGKLLIREDDSSLNRIKTRIKRFEKITVPVINHLRKEGKLIEIDGSKSIKEVEKELYKRIGKIKL